MDTMTLLRATATAAALALAPMAASAVTISSVELTSNLDGTGTLDTVAVFLNPEFDSVSSGGEVLNNITASTTGVTRSPFEGSENYGEVFSSVQAGTTATFTYTIAQNSLSMIWGSPDTYNSLTLLLDSVVVGTPIVPDSTTGAPPAPQQGAWQFSVTNVLFDEVRFFSGSNALEFANYSTTAIPLPAAGLLLLTALGGMKVMSRRRKLEDA